MRTKREQDEHDEARLIACAGCKGLEVLYPDESDCWKLCEEYQKELQEIIREWKAEDLK